MTESVKREGNVVLAFTSDIFLMLDCDIKREDDVTKFSKRYPEHHDLGSSAVFKTSDTPQVDLFGERLGNYCIIFGKKISYDEIVWHVQEAYRLGMVNKGFTDMRHIGSITIRVNAKNNKIPPPRPICYFSNGDDTGIMKFIDHWVNCRKMERLEHEYKKNQA
jgi:hypothetical protein